MPTIAEQRAQLVKAAQEAATMLDVEPTDENIKAATEAADAFEAFEKRVADAEAISARFKQMNFDANDDSKVEAKSAESEASTLGERYIKSGEYKHFKKMNPSGVGSEGFISLARVNVGSMRDYMHGRKAEGQVIGTPLSHPSEVRYPTVDLTQRRPLTLLDLVSRGTAQGDFDYVQIISASNNAAIVAEATSPDNGLKPTSDFQTQLATAKAYTYADGYTVTNQMLADAPAFATFMNAQLAYNLDSVIEDKLLNGTGNSGEPVGILNTTGVQEVQASGAEAMQLIEAVRKAKTKLRNYRAIPQAVLLNPEDAEKIDLLRDANERFYGNGPFGMGPGTLWAMPIVESELIEVGTALLGDFNQVALLDREGLSVTAFNQHKDYAQRNLVYVRAELRAMQAVWQPGHLVHVVQGA